VASVGAKAGIDLSVRNFTQEELRAKWPKLIPGTYTHASQATPRYNCFAFAVGDDRHWWEPEMHGGRFRWAEGVGDGIDSWAQVFVLNGYEPTNNLDHEDGYEKVAIYVELETLRPSHVAISDGVTWKSKLGKLQDIEHATLNQLEGDYEWEYGIVERVLRRRINQ